MTICVPLLEKTLSDSLSLDAADEISPEIILKPSPYVKILKLIIKLKSKNGTEELFFNSRVIWGGGGGETTIQRKSILRQFLNTFKAIYTIIVKPIEVIFTTMQCSFHVTSSEVVILKSFYSILKSFYIIWSHESCCTFVRINFLILAKLNRRT